MEDREVMMDNIIKKYGFEDDITIHFCNLCESEHNKWNDGIIAITYKILMKCG